MEYCEPIKKEDLKKTKMMGDSLKVCFFLTTSVKKVFKHWYPQSQHTNKLQEEYPEIKPDR